jgi:glycosyltransferase involved in cell wall biosynthesis
MSHNATAPALLLVANYDSAVGYAWWLMESYWATLARRYQASHRVLLSYPSISTLPDEISGAPITAVVAPFARTDIRSVWNQLRFLKRHRVRTVYFSDQETSHWRYLAYRFAGVQSIVVHDHTPGLRTTPRGWRKLLKALAQRLPWISADGVIGATEFVTERHISVTCVPRRKCFTVPNGIRQRVNQIPQEDVHRKFRIPADRRVIVATGRAHRIKGVPFALSCMQELLHRRFRTDVHFLYCGDGPHLGEFIKQAQVLRVSEHVTFAGRQDVSTFLSSCDVAFHPSEAEVGYSLSILEYMQAALPVIVPDNPSVCGATVHDKTGLIYSEGDAREAASAIEKLLDDREKAASIGREAQKVVAEQHSLERAQVTLVRVLESIDRNIRPR